MSVRTHRLFGREVTGDLTREDVVGVLAQARSRAPAIAATPIASVLSLLERVGQLWADPAFPFRQRVLAELPEQIGFAREMVELELYGLTMALSRPYLEGKIAAELGRLDAQDVWHRRGQAGFQRALPRGVTLHVASGNVSTTGVLSLIEGLLTRNVNLLKVASNAPLLPLLFADSLALIDGFAELATSIAVMSWSGEQTPHHELLAREADAVVVWGGDEVVAAYRAHIGPSTRLVTYGPRVSAAFVGAYAVGPASLSETVAAIARDVCLWDQSACSSPQCLYLEAKGDALDTFLAALAAAMEAEGARLPMGGLGLQERAEITKERELAVIDELMGQARLIVPPHPGWTLVVDHDPAFRLSPLFRTLYIKPVADLHDVVPHLAPYRAYLQTAGLAIEASRLPAFAEALFGVGLLRITRLGEMSGGFPGEPHDGQHGLTELVRWVSLDVPGAAQAADGRVFMDTTTAQHQGWAARRRLVEDILPAAPYYNERLPRRLRDEADWRAVPLLTKADLAAHTPPAGMGILTEAPGNGHWLRSGGSSGDPTLSIFTFADYEADMARAARGAMAAGLRPGDRVANLFFAGDLYGSFLSLNRVLELVGCNSFPYTNHAPIESVLHGLKTFEIDVVIGLSSWVQHVLHAAVAAGLTRGPRAVFYAGEPFHEREREFLREKLGGSIQTIASIGYGAVDAGPMGYQCSACVGDEHHLHDDHVYLEILDPATGLPVATGAIGEVIVTSLNRRLMPLLRYGIGDLARWLPGPCPCGDPAPRLALCGRLGDRVRWRETDLHYAEVQALVAALPALGANPQLVLHTDRLVLRVEIGEGVPGDVLASLEHDLRETYPTLDGDFSVQGGPAGFLERVGRTGKIMRVVDARDRPLSP